MLAYFGLSGSNNFFMMGPANIKLCQLVDSMNSTKLPNKTKNVINKVGRGDEHLQEVMKS